MTKAILDPHYLIKSELNSWGNSVGLRIPKKILDLLGLEKGSKINIAVQNQKLILTKDISNESQEFWDRVEKIDVKALAKNTKKYHKDLAKEFETKPVGKEVW